MYTFDNLQRDGTMNRIIQNHTNYYVFFEIHVRNCTSYIFMKHIHHGLLCIFLKFFQPIPLFRQCIQLLLCPLSFLQQFVYFLIRVAGL